MFHGVAFDRSGQLSLDERYLREHLDSIIADHDRIGTIMAERSALTLTWLEKCLENKELGTQLGRSKMA